MTSPRSDGRDEVVSQWCLHGLENKTNLRGSQWFTGFSPIRPSCRFTDAALQTCTSARGSETMRSYCSQHFHTVNVINQGHFRWGCVIGRDIVWFSTFCKVIVGIHILFGYLSIVALAVLGVLLAVIVAVITILSLPKS